MSDIIAKQRPGTSASGQRLDLNLYYEEADVSNNQPDWGLQGFVYKTYAAGAAGDIAILQGAPVGEKLASGGGTVTAAIANSGAALVKHRAGGLATFAVTVATATAYGWVQCVGLNRYAAQTTGALAAAAQGEWTANNTIAAFTNGQFIFCTALVAASGGTVAAGGLRLGVQ